MPILRGRFRPTIFFCLAVGLLGASLGPVQAAYDPIQAMLAQVNKVRAKAGLRPLAYDARLARAAQAQSSELAQAGRLSHQTSGGDLKARVRRAGYSFWLVAENLAAGMSDPAKVVGAWLHSPGHRQNLLSPAATTVGVGYVARGAGRYGHVWTLILARP